MWTTRKCRYGSFFIVAFLNIVSVKAGQELCFVENVDSQWSCRDSYSTRGICAVRCKAGEEPSCHFHVRHKASGKCIVSSCPRDVQVPADVYFTCRCPHGVGYQLRFFGNGLSCVFVSVSPNRANYSQAKELCRDNLNGRLIKADSTELIRLVNKMAYENSEQGRREMQFGMGVVAGYTEDDGVWVGFNDIDIEGRLDWSDGTVIGNQQRKVLFRRTNSDEDKRDCGRTFNMRSDYLDSYYCMAESPFACEILM